MFISYADIFVSSHFDIILLIYNNITIRNVAAADAVADCWLSTCKVGDFRFIYRYSKQF